MGLAKKFFGLKGIEFEKDTPPLGQLYKKSLSIAWPATIEGALISIIGSIDTMMVGTLGSDAIAAVGITTQPRMILLILAQALCVGTTALIARRKGEGDQEAANSTLSQSMCVMTLLGIVMSLAGYFGAGPLMELAGANSDTLEMSTAYFRIISMGFVFNYWSLCLCAAMRAIGKTRITMVTNISANLVNVFLNFCLINGNLGFPRMGVRGAALATAIGTFVSCIIAFIFATRPSGYLRLRLRLPRFDKRTLGGLMRVGSSSMAESVFLRLGFLLNAKMIAGIGTAEMATYQIVQQVTSLSFTLGDGIAASGATLVGQSLGAKRRDLALANVRIARKLSVVSSLLLIIVILFTRRYLAMLFTTEENIIAGASLAFLVVLAGIIPQNGRVVYSGCLRGAGDVKYVAICSLISVTVLRPIFTYVFCYPLNRAMPYLQLAMTGPWIAFVLDSFIRDYLLLRRINKGKWLMIKL
jgi:putative MATE family efflux protein